MTSVPATKHSIDAVRKLATKDGLYVIGFDFLFYALIYIGFSVYYNFFQKIASPLQNIISFLDLTQGQITTAHEQALQAQSIVMQNFITTFFISLLALVIFMLAAWTLSRGLIWARVMRKKLSTMYFIKLFGLNFLWFVMAVAFLTAVNYVISLPNITFWLTNNMFFFYLALFVIVVLLIYFSTILYCRFASDNRIIMSIWMALKTGVVKIGNLLIPLLAIAVFLVVFYKLPPSSIIFKILNITVVLLFSAWLRYTIALTLKKMKV